MMKSKILLSAAMALLISTSAMASQSNPVDAKGETVDERISNLHSELKITADEEKKWDDVAKAMRENSENMHKVIESDEKKADEKDLTAEDDLKMYQKMVQAHVDGLKNLRSAFDSLYDAMPDDQKKVADQVFANVGQPHGGKE